MAASVAIRCSQRCCVSLGFCLVCARPGLPLDGRYPEALKADAEEFFVTA